MSTEQPRFGDRIENRNASLHNPTRVGTFVRVVRVTGRMNPGIWWECTDERGKFWQVRPESCDWTRSTASRLGDAG